MFRKWIIRLAVFCGLIIVGGWLLKSNKYYVKRFIKDHEILYAASKKLINFKYSVTQGFSKKEEANKESAAPTPKTGPWFLTVDAAQSGIKYERFWGGLGYESFKNGVLTGQNRQLFELMKETNAVRAGSFRYVRAHNLFSDGKPPWGEGCVKVRLDDRGGLVYDWELADQVFDRILNHNLKPIVEFGFMPDVLASIADRRQKWGKANISPPNDYKKWRDLVYDTVSHLVDRYGADELAQWYFEVWNEPDHGSLFWIEDPENKPWGDLEEYFKLYDYAVDGAKAALPAIRVGGPASAGLGVGKLLEHAYLQRNHVTGDEGSPVDFVSSHAYGKVYPSNRRKGKKNIVDGIKMKIDRAIKHDHKKVGRNMKGLPFLLTETGPGTRGGEYYNTRYVAAWFAKLIDAVFYIGQRWGQAYQPDEVILWSSEQVAKSFRAGPGVAASLKTVEGRKVFKRPSYNILAALGFLGDELLPEIHGADFGDPVHALATRERAESVEVLVYHLREWDYDCTSQDSQQVTLAIENLPFSSYRVRLYTIDREHSNSYAAWMGMGQPEPLTKRQIAFLDQKDDLQLSEDSYLLETEHSRFERTLTVQSNSVALLVLSRESLTN